MDNFQTLYNEFLQSSIKESLPGEILERFEVISCLAFDDNKELYVVREKQNSKKCILRVTKGETMDDAAAEAEILRSLDHPAIPKMIGYWSEKDRGYLIREYFDGVTLHALIKERGVIRAELLLDTAIDLCDVLSYIHAQNPPVIHRDIKPENIIVAKNGAVKLIDFGIARKYLEGAAKDTQIIGTELYMAPEQYGSEQTDGRADLYSLGMLMLFMAVGQPDVQRLQQEFPHRALLPVVRKCLQYDRARRYQSAEHLKRKLLCVKRRTKQKIVLCAALLAAIVIALAAGLMIGREQGFRQGVDSIMDIPVDKNRPFTHEELNQPITFENRYIDLAVRNALSKMPGDVINLSEVVSIDTIRIFGTHILHPTLDTQLVKTHIEKGAVAYATSDGFPIDIRGDISDLSSIPNFYYLRNLTLTSQAVSDLSPLAGMKLEEISLADNFVGNLLPLKDMATLRKLDICQNPLGDLTPISRLLSLEYLDISQTQVTDLRPLTGLTKLQTLRMSYCDISDISVLAELPNLAEVDISHTFVTDLTPLFGRASPITITCAGIPDEVVAQVRGVENVIVIEE